MDEHERRRPFFWILVPTCSVAREVFDFFVLSLHARGLVVRFKPREVPMGRTAFAAGLTASLALALVAAADDAPAARSQAGKDAPVFSSEVSLVSIPVF